MRMTLARLRFCRPSPATFGGAFFLQEFLVSWITSQARDKEELGSGSTGLTDEQRKSNYFQTRSSQEAMFRYNADKLQQQKAGLEKLKGRAMGGRNTHEYA